MRQWYIHRKLIKKLEKLILDETIAWGCDWYVWSVMDDDGPQATTYFQTIKPAQENCMSELVSLLVEIKSNKRYGNKKLNYKEYLDLVVLDVDLVEALRNWENDTLDDEVEARKIIDQTKKVHVILGYDYQKLVGYAEIRSDGNVHIVLIDNRIKEEVVKQKNIEGVSLGVVPAISVTETYGSGKTPSV